MRVSVGGAIPIGRHAKEQGIVLQDKQGGGPWKSAVTRLDNGSYRGQIMTTSLRTDIDIVPSRDMSAETRPDFRVMTQRVDIDAGSIWRGETSGKDYVSLSLAAPEFGPRKLHVNLGCVVDRDDERVRPDL